MPSCRLTYIHLIYSTEQLKVKGLAQRSNSGSWAVLGYERMSFHCYSNPGGPNHSQFDFPVQVSLINGTSY